MLDEADHLCDLGFYPAVDALIGQPPAAGQRMLLSATLDGDVDRWSAPTCTTRGCTSSTPTPARSRP